MKKITAFIELSKGEKVFKYSRINSFGQYTSGINQYRCIGENDKDILKSLKDTLCKLINAGCDEIKIHQLMGAFIPDLEEMEELEKSGEYILLDFGYIIPDSVSSFTVLPSYSNTNKIIEI